MPDKGYVISDQYAAYFVTFTVVGWIDLFTRLACKKILIDSLQYCQQNKDLIINAYVIMGSHMHLIIRAKKESAGISAIIRDFKKYTAKELLKWVLKSGRESRKEWMEIVFKYHAKFNSNNKTYQIWQQNNQPKILLHPKFISQKLDYIHNNPVVEQIVQQPEDYIYSSARNYMGTLDTILTVNLIDFGIQEGYIMT